MFRYLFVGMVTSAAVYAQCVELNPTILMFNEWDMARCPGQVRKLARESHTRVQLLSTFHFDPDWDSKTPKSFCFLTRDGKCTKLGEKTGPVISRYFVSCIEEAVAHGIDVSIAVHLDDQSYSGFWRNELIFDPTEQYGGTSYSSGVLDPIADAILRVSRATSAPLRFNWSLQGEMGATIARYPEAYREIIENLRARLTEANVGLGISLNYNKVNGFARVSGRRNYNQLLREVDFIGVSAYHPLPVDSEPRDYSWSLVAFERNLRKLGIRLPKDKPIQFTEFGLGGGNEKNDGNTIAESPAEAALAPYSGIYGEYSADRDPWQRSVLSEFRREFHLKLLKFLESDASQVNIQNVFLWNANSWDVLGLYTDSNDYRDDFISNEISEHNSQCTTGKRDLE